MSENHHWILGCTRKVVFLCNIKALPLSTGVGRKGNKAYDHQLKVCLHLLDVLLLKKLFYLLKSKKYWQRESKGDGKKKEEGKWERKEEWEGWERNLPSTSSLSKWPWQLGLGHAKARSQKDHPVLPFGWQGAKYLGTEFEVEQLGLQQAPLSQAVAQPAEPCCQPLSEFFVLKGYVLKDLGQFSSKCYALFQRFVWKTDFLTTQQSQLFKNSKMLCRLDLLKNICSRA